MSDAPVNRRRTERRKGSLLIVTDRPAGFRCRTIISDGLGELCRVKQSECGSVSITWTDLTTENIPDAELMIAALQECVEIAKKLENKS